MYSSSPKDSKKKSYYSLIFLGKGTKAMTEISISHLGNIEHISNHCGHDTSDERNKYITP